MNTDQLLKKIEKLIEPIRTQLYEQGANIVRVVQGQRRLEQGQAQIKTVLETLEAGQKDIRETMAIIVFFPLMKRSTKWFIWRCATLPGSGRCRSATGSQHSIALRWNSPSGFPDEQQLVTQCGSKSRQLAAHETTHAKKRGHARLHM